MNKTVLSLILLLMIVCTPGVQAQVYNEMDASGNINQYDERGNQNFNPNKRIRTPSTTRVSMANTTRRATIIRHV